MGDQMATWTYQRRTVKTEKTSALASKPLLLFRKNGPVVFTKKYVKHTLFSKKEYPPGVEGMIVDWHTGIFEHPGGSEATGPGADGGEVA